MSTRFRYFSEISFNIFKQRSNISTSDGGGYVGKVERIMENIEITVET